MYVSTLRRGLLLVAMTVFLSVAGAHAAWGSSSSAYDTVTVRTGDTVWSIAAARYPGADTRDKVGEILAANGLHDAALRPGQHLRVPSS
jgi:LysM repeat protein